MRRTQTLRLSVYTLCPAVIFALTIAAVWMAVSGPHSETALSAISWVVAFNMIWGGVSLLLLMRGRGKLGPNRRRDIGLLAEKPDHPDELFVWNWTLQLCCAVIAVVICVIALVIASTR